MEFIDSAYLFLQPLLLFILISVSNKWKIAVFRLMAVSNGLLIFHSFFVTRQLYGIYRLVHAFRPQEVSYHCHFGWFDLRMILIVLLPFLFVFKRFQKSILLTVLMIVLLCWDKIETVLNVDISSFDIVTMIKILNYSCLYIAAYALLWLLQRLPYQQENT